MPENIFAVGQYIEAIEEGVQTGSNAVHGIINDIEDQTGQNDLNLNCVGQKSTGECIQDNLNRFEKKTKNFFLEIYGKACVRDYQCSLTSYCSSCKYYTANVCRDLQGLCGEIGVRGFQIYGDCMYTRNPCNF